MLTTPFLAPLWAAFSFLTRLVPARTFPQSVMAASPRWFPLVGLALGLIAASIIGLGLVWQTSTHASMTAWLYIAIMFWATRGLHWDGLCDCADAWGSGARGEKFQTILKDSRLGAFGALGAILLILAQWAALETLFMEATPTGSTAGLASVFALAPIYVVLVLSPAFGRAAMLGLAAMLPPHPVSTLGRMVAPGCTPALAIVWWGLLTLVWNIFFGYQSVAILCLICAFCLCPLYRLAKRECGFNGDFLGCACLIIETACLWAAALTVNLS